MPAERTKKGAAKVRHLGRSKTKIDRYYLSVYPKRKILHMLKNNGVAFAMAWGKERLIQGLVHDMATKRGMV